METGAAAFLACIPSDPASQSQLNSGDPLPFCIPDRLEAMLVRATSAIDALMGCLGMGGTFFSPGRAALESIALEALLVGPGGRLTLPHADSLADARSNVETLTTRALNVLFPQEV